MVSVGAFGGMQFGCGLRRRSGRSEDTALLMPLKYEPSKVVEVSVSRPLGVVFEEVEETQGVWCVCVRV